MFTHTFCRNLPQKFTAEQTAMAVRSDEKGKLGKKKRKRRKQLVQEKKAWVFVHPVITNGFPSRSEQSLLTVTGISLRGWAESWTRSRNPTLEWLPWGKNQKGLQKGTHLPIHHPTCREGQKSLPPPVLAVFQEMFRIKGVWTLPHVFIEHYGSQAGHQGGALQEVEKTGSCVMEKSRYVVRLVYY